MHASVSNAAKLPFKPRDRQEPGDRGGGPRAQLRAHWAAPQAVPKAYTAAEDQHLKAVVDRAVTEIKAHWAAAEAPAPEATPCRKQILSSERTLRQW